MKEQELRERYRKELAEAIKHIETPQTNTVTLNQALLEKQDITPEGEELIQELHGRKIVVYETIEATDDPTELEILADLITQIEFALQRAWGFPQSVAYHRFWKTPKCSCPQMDNEERYGRTKQFIIASSCRLHGDNTGFLSFMESQ